MNGRVSVYLSKEKRGRKGKLHNGPERGSPNSFVKVVILLRPVKKEKRRVAPTYIASAPRRSYKKKRRR